MAESSKWKKRIIQTVAAIAILVAGIAGMKKLASLRKPPVKVEQEIPAPLVTAERVYSEDIVMKVRGFGTVSPRSEVQVIPQVAGVVVQCDPDFVNGGFFTAKKPLIVIDQRDYKAAVQSAEATVARMQVQLDKELAEAQVARQEWTRLNGDKQPDSPLVFREPQIRQAQAELKSAQAQLETAKLNLERTVIAMPFDGRVVKKSVDIGQFVSPGQVLGSVYATDIVEIVVPLEDWELKWFDVPMYGHTQDGDNPGTGSDAIVSAKFAGGLHTWTGKVVRTQGKVDEKSRMVDIVVEVQNPFEPSNGRVPLTPGMFVEVQIQGKVLENAFRVPRYAVRGDNQMWVVKESEEISLKSFIVTLKSYLDSIIKHNDFFESRLYHNPYLKIQNIEIARQDNKYSYITSGLEEDDFVVTSSIDAVADGMKLRVHISILFPNVTNWSFRIFLIIPLLPIF